MTFAPIALFVYNRPGHTLRTIEALAQNELAKDSRLYIYSDGPKDKSSINEVKAVRDVLNTIDGFKNIEIIEREENIGLASNIIDGVTKIIQQHGSIIVLEDDIITSPYFLSFMNKALEFYQKHKKVWHISGWNYPIESEGTGDTFMWRVMNCWGWATWSDRWQYFEKNPERLMKEWSGKMIHRFNLDGSYRFWDQVKGNYQGNLNTWAIFWYATIFENNGLCVQSSKTLAYNTGFDGTGEHCSDSITYDSGLSSKKDWIFDESFNESIIATQRIKLFYKGNQMPLLKRIIFHLTGIFSKIRKAIIH